MKIFKNIIGLLSILFAVNSISAQNNGDADFFVSNINEVNYSGGLTQINSAHNFTEIAQFANQVKLLAENHKWNEFISLCNTEHYQIQKNIGQTDPAYIRDALNLGFVDNNLKCKKKSDNFKCLNTILKIEWLGVPNVQAQNTDMFNVYGYVYTKKGLKVRISFSANKIGGKFKIGGALG